MNTNFVNLTERDLQLLASDYKHKSLPTDIALGGVFHTRILREKDIAKAIEQGDLDRLRWARRKFMLNPYKAQFVEIDNEQSHNLLPDGGLNYVLGVIFGTSSRYTTWYVGCFTSNWTPGAGALSDWAKPTGGLATELPNSAYDESGRQPVVFGTPANKTIQTTTSAVFTFSSGTSGISLYGATLNSTNIVSYAQTDHVLIAATRFSQPKTGLGHGDRAEISYQISASSSA